MTTIQLFKHSYLHHIFDQVYKHSMVDMTREGRNLTSAFCSRPFKLRKRYGHYLNHLPIARLGFSKPSLAVGRWLEYASTLRAIFFKCLTVFDLQRRATGLSGLTFRNSGTAGNLRFAPGVAAKPDQRLRHCPDIEATPGHHPVRIITGALTM